MSLVKQGTNTMPVVESLFKLLIYTALIMFSCLGASAWGEAKLKPGLPPELKSEFKPRILTTIKPLQMIVYELSLGVFQPDRLLPDGFTPHDYHLKPRDRQAVQEADLIVWLGPEMEPYLNALVEQYTDASGTENLTAKAVNVLAIPGIKKLPSRAISHHRGGHSGDGHHEEDHGAEDGHIWLSPENVSLMAEYLGKKLIEMDAVHKDRYEENLALFLAKIEALDLTSSKGSNAFLVYHDAFQYLEHALQRYAHEIIVSDAEDTPGIRHIIGVQKAIQKEGIECVVVGNLYNKSLLDKLFGYRVYRTATIDALASDVVLGRDSYADFLQKVSHQLLSCGALSE